VSRFKLAGSLLAAFSAALGGIGVDLFSEHTDSAVKMIFAATILLTVGVVLFAVGRLLETKKGTAP
jgi:hypothetical protein